jgi:DNA-binding SARP family transcriptional activator
MPRDGRKLYAMIHFRTLGSIDLRGDDGRDFSDLLSRPKRVALLAYLAIEYSGRYCRRDALFGVFWPEQDAASARNALSQALHVLRRSLGADAIVNRGQEEVGVDAALLRCDAAAVRGLIADERFEEAADLYAGDLMPGFFVSDAPEFERWIEEERSELRRLVATGTWRVVKAKTNSGHLRDAIALGARARAVAPADEVGLRRYLTLLDRTGNRSRALETYDEFARYFAKEFELEPAPETRELVERIKARVSLTEESPDAVVAGKISDVRGAAPRPSAHHADPPKPLGIRPRRGARFAMAVLLAGAGIWLIWEILIGIRSR